MLRTQHRILIQSLFFLLFSAGIFACTSSGTPNEQNDSLQVLTTANRLLPAEADKGPKPVRTGAERLVHEKLHLVTGKKVAIVANHTSLLLNGTHLVDSLHALGIKIQRVFAPEHGFRGDHDAGAKVSSSVDAKTGIPVVSLYGKTKKPTADMLKDVDMVIFDIQDVGARFYTYISTLAYVMEACGENKKPLLVLDRPNPNGWYVDGPVLEAGLESFVGMHHIPIVHGMTVGEYAQMVNGENWLKGGVKCIVDVLTVEGYDHTMRWASCRLPWIAPSPNLATEYAAYMYPALCWYEGMPVSVGRGTDSAFIMIGAPWHEGYHRQFQIDSLKKEGRPDGAIMYGLDMKYAWFTPRSIPGKSTTPLFEDELCYGVAFQNRVEGKELFMAGISMLLNWQEEARNVKLDEPLFQPFFKNLAGTRALQGQIEKGITAEAIYESWRKPIADFMQIRKKWLLYPDFVQSN